MERRRTHMNRKRRCAAQQQYSTDVEEPEYDVVDDHAEGLNVRIFPARPLHDDAEYADRDLPRSSSGQNLSSISLGNSTHFPREIPVPSGPVINRDSKPGRTKTRRDTGAPFVSLADQPTQRPSRSPHPFVLELENQLHRLTLQEPCRRDGQKATKRAEFSSHNNGLQNADSYTNQRHSLDLDNHDVETRSQRGLERVSSKHHHEWPQTKEDIHQHVFVPMEKPTQIYAEEDWYVGPCIRADAEHALHLVNKDGAFLVRDCSINTNSEPLVLTVYHDKKVFNVKIRFLESVGKYALGTGQRSSDMFDSVADIVKFHSIFPIILVSGRNVPGSKYPENCVLTCPVTRRDVDQLLQ